LLVNIVLGFVPIGRLVILDDIGFLSERQRNTTTYRASLFFQSHLFYLKVLIPRNLKESKRSSIRTNYLLIFNVLKEWLVHILIFFCIMAVLTEISWCNFFFNLLSSYFGNGCCPCKTITSFDLVVEYHLSILGCKTLSLFWHCFMSYFVYWKLGQNVICSTYSPSNLFPNLVLHVYLKEFPEFGTPQVMVLFWRDCLFLFKASASKYFLYYYNLWGLHITYQYHTFLNRVLHCH